MPESIFSSFGLRENPFKINPDPRFIFLTRQAEATFDELTYGIRERKGLILLAGEVGTGKTMLLRRLLDWLGEQKMPTALIFNSRINPDHLLDFILNDFGISCASSLKTDKLLSLNSWLLDRYRAGQTPVLIVDEAQGLSPQALEEIRLLLNFETPRHKLLQVILAGQPELEEKLKRHELRQLRQRITIRCKTAPLSVEQTHGYIQERLRIAGAGAQPIFAPEAVNSVYAYSHGIPRVINVLCEQALIHSCADGATTVSPQIVDQAARDCQLDRAESIARILHSGSYSRTSLDDVGSILAAVSGSLGTYARPDHIDQSAAQSPSLAGQSSERSSSPRISQSPAISRLPLTPVTAPLEANQPVKLEPDSPSFDVEKAPSQTEFVSRDGAETRQKSGVDTAFAAVFRVGRSWYESFFSEVRLVRRQVRQALRSAEARYWKPFLRDTRHQLRRARSSATRLASDPRWRQSWNRYAYKTRMAWSRARAAMPAWFAGRIRRAPQEPVNSSRVPHAQRQRSITSLKRWLHQPLSGNRKTAASTRQSPRA